MSKLQALQVNYGGNSLERTSMVAIILFVQSRCPFNTGSLTYIYVVYAGIPKMFVKESCMLIRALSVKGASTLLLAKWLNWLFLS